MKLSNFEISSPIYLRSEGLSWDLHNFADFDGLQLIPNTNTAIMRWRVRTSEPNPWGCYENKSSGVELHFKKLLYLSIGPRDDELEMSEDTCVSDIVKVNPNIVHEEPIMRAVSETSNSFRLRFQFQSARVIEIESDRVELVPLG